MILIRNRLVVGIIKKILTAVFKAFYKVFDLFNLHLTLLVGAIGAVLFLTGVFSKNQSLVVIFLVVLACTLVYAVLATLKKVFKLGGGDDVSRGKGVQIIKGPNGGQTKKAEPEKRPQTPIVEPTRQQEAPRPKVVDVPRYYRVKQNPDYLMAEYSDRYELYKKSGGGLIKVRVDYK